MRPVAVPPQANPDLGSAVFQAKWSKRVSDMSKDLVIVRNDSCTYAVRVEFGKPLQTLAGGQSLDRERLAIELSQHGCTENAIADVLQEVEHAGVSRISL